MEQLIGCLYGANTTAEDRKRAEGELLAFQRRGIEAWSECLNLIARPSEEVQFFAAQTLAKLSLTGGAGTDYRQAVDQLLSCGQRELHESCAAQLARAVSAMALWLYATVADTRALPLPELLGVRHSQTLVLQVMVELPTVLMDARLAIGNLSKRNIFQKQLLPQNAIVLDFFKAAARNESEFHSSQCLAGLTAWVRAESYFSMLEVDGCAPTDAETGTRLVEALITHPLFEFIEAAACHPTLATGAAELFGEFCSSVAIRDSFDVRWMLVMLLNRLASVAEAHTNVWGERQLLLAFFASFEAAATSVLPASLYADNKLAPAAQLAVSKAVNFHSKRDDAVRLAAVESMYALLGHQISLIAQAKSEPALTAVVEQNNAVLKPLLIPLVNVIYRTLLPFTPTNDLEGWLKFRDICALLLTDLALIVEHTYILERVGADLQSVIEMSRSDSDREVAWTRIEAAFLTLTAVAPRAPAGKDVYIPMALALISQMTYPTDRVEGSILRCSAARLILWTAGYVATQPQMFSKCFKELEQFLTFLCHVKAGNDSQRAFMHYTESIVVEALVAVCTAAAATGHSEKRQILKEDDIHKALETLLTITAKDALSLDSKCAVLMGAGTLLTSLPAGSVASLHEKLVSSIEGKLRHVTQSERIDSETLVQIFKLALTALECIDGSQSLGSTAVSSTESIHSPTEVPVAISTLLNHWSLIETAYTNFNDNEAIVEAACHSLISILADHKTNPHIIPLLSKTVPLLCSSFKRRPSVFILAAMRTLLRVFGFFVEEEVVGCLGQVIAICASCVLGFFEQDSENAFINNPDVAGMSVDTLNAGLTTPMMAAIFLESAEAQQIVKHISAILATCEHPRVRLTLILMLLRMTKWLTPKNASMELPLWLAMHYTQELKEAQRKQVFEVWQASVKRAHNRSKEIVSASLKDLLAQLYRLLTSVHEDSAEWIGFIGTINVFLLSCRELPVADVMTDVVMSVEPTLVDLLSVETVASTLHVLTTSDDHRLQCTCLCQVADEARARYQQQRG